MAEEVTYIVYHHAISPFRKAAIDQIPMQITLMDIAKRPLLTRERR
jgi:hypothetical protein